MDSIAGTTWKSERVEYDGGWCQDELSFTDTGYSYIQRTKYGSTERPFTGTYKFDRPTITLQAPLWPGESYVQPTYGTVKGRSMTVQVLVGDILWSLELKKQ